MVRCRDLSRWFVRIPVPKNNEKKVKKTYDERYGRVRGEGKEGKNESEVISEKNGEEKKQA